MLSLTNYYQTIDYYLFIILFTMSFVTKMTEIASKITDFKKDIEETVGGVTNKVVGKVEHLSKLINEYKKHSQRFIDDEYKKVKDYVKDSEKFVNEYIADQKKMVDKWIADECDTVFNQYKLTMAKKIRKTQTMAAPAPEPPTDELREKGAKTEEDKIKEIAEGIPNPVPYPKMPEINIPWPEIPWPPIELPLGIVPDPADILQNVKTMATQVKKDTMSQLANIEQLTSKFNSIQNTFKSII